MYLIHKTQEKTISHIVKPEDREKIFQDFAEKGDTLCMIVSGMRKEGKPLKKRWNLRSTYLGKMCKNCLKIENQMIELMLKMQREEYQRTGTINRQKNSVIGAKSDG